MFDFKTLKKIDTIIIIVSSNILTSSVYLIINFIINKILKISNNFNDYRNLFLIFFAVQFIILLSLVFFSILFLGNYDYKVLNFDIVLSAFMTGLIIGGYFKINNYSLKSYLYNIPFYSLILFIIHISKLINLFKIKRVDIKALEKKKFSEIIR